MSKAISLYGRQFFAPDEVLDTNAEGIAIIKRSESFMAKWYLCPADVWTIGFGTTEGSIRGVTRALVPGPISPDVAEGFMVKSLARTYEPAIERSVRVPLTLNQFSACASLCYNIGPRQFETSTLVRLLNAGDYRGAARQFDRWVYSGGKKLSGLVTRRRAERALFENEPDIRLVMEIEPMPVMRVTPLPVNLPPPSPRQLQ